MKYLLTIEDSAQFDLSEITSFYNFSNKNTAVKFVVYVEKTLKQLSDNPFIFQKTYGDIRKANIGYFKYSIFYRIYENKIIVFAVLHQKRSPNIITERTSGH